jgi:hypothetical protein
MEIERAKFRLVQPAEIAARGNVLIGEAQLADEPQDLLNIEGAAATPDFEHVHPPL